MLSDAEVLIHRALVAGWQVTLDAAGQPKLLRVNPDAPLPPPTLVADLKLDRDLVVRHLKIASVISRCHGKAIYGFDSTNGLVERARGKKGVLDEWDHLCVEGDGKWVRLPKLPSD